MDQKDQDSLTNSLILASESQSQTSDNKSPGRPVGNIWNNTQRKDAAVAWVIHGNTQKVSEITGVPLSTLYTWLKSDWWPRFLEEAKREHQELIEARLSDIVERATDALLDRIIYGDVKLVYNKGLRTYEEVRTPVVAKDLKAIVAELSDRLRVIRNQPTRVSVEAKFDPEKIAREFAQIAERNREKIVSEQ